MKVARARLYGLVLGAMLVSAPLLHADTIKIATFTITSINGGNFVDDSEGAFEGTPDRYFSMGIFDSAASSVLNACAAGCLDDSDPTTEDGRILAVASSNSGVGSWILNRSITKVLSGPGAFFYFGLWDEDSDEDDALGSHWFFSSAEVTGTAVFNNNLSPYRADHPITTVAGRDVEGPGFANNYTLNYTVTFVEYGEPDPSPAAVPEAPPLLLLVTGISAIIASSRIAKAPIRRRPRMRMNSSPPTLGCGDVDSITRL